MIKLPIFGTHCSQQVQHYLYEYKMQMNNFQVLITRHSS